MPASQFILNLLKLMSYNHFFSSCFVSVFITPAITLIQSLISLSPQQLLCFSHYHPRNYFDAVINLIITSAITLFQSLSPQQLLCCSHYHPRNYFVAIIITSAITLFQSLSPHQLLCCSHYHPSNYFVAVIITSVIILLQLL